MLYTEISLLSHLPLTVPYTLAYNIIYGSGVRDILTQLKISKPPDPNGINHILFKEGVPLLVEPFILLFNISLQKKKFPTSWKNSNIISLFKNASNKENYRPISLLLFYIV